MPNNPTVFVSHSHLDNTFGLRLIADLRAKLGNTPGNPEVWYDISGGLHGGDEWWREIVRQITARDVFMVILSPNALSSKWVVEEMEHAYYLKVTQGKRLLPIRYQPCDFPADMGHWGRIHGLPCRDPQHDEQDYRQDVAAILADILRTPGSGIQPPAPQPSTPPPPQPVRAAPARVPPIHTPPPSISPDHISQRLASLGFVGQVLNGVEVIIPPLCVVPAGPFPMGSDKRRDPRAPDDELWKGDIYVSAYEIGKYPITIAEYACFQRATGKQPSTWRPPSDTLDLPVDNATWQDAVAYMDWLATTTNQPWRLPTEAEWEKAARGTDGRIYPWGDQWDKTRANTSDGGPKHTTPVGSYPSGESPYHAQDMAGNVWEWCSSLYKPYPYEQNNGRENINSTGNRVLRGGAWFNHPLGARAASRYGHLWYVDGGFRACRGRQA